MRIISRLVLLPLLIVSFSSAAHSFKVPKDITELKLTKVSDDVYVAYGVYSMPDKDNLGFISNTGIVLADEGVLVFDSGGSKQVGEMLVASIKQLTDKPVIAVFNSHVHGDHWMGNAEIRKAFPNAKIYAHERAIERLKAGEADQWLDIFMQATDNGIAGTELVLPDNALKGGETLTIAGNTYKTHHPEHAHTDSDLMLEYTDGKTLFAGDVVAYGTMVSGARPQDFSAKGQIEALAHALELPVDTYVPGHGPTGGREIPEATKRFLETLYESVSTYYDEGLADFEMRDKVVADMAEFSDWNGFDQIGRLISHIYQQVEAAEFQ
jgi:glyoxylase-like metal-dependent hydrolase (beta-lactamase superfamily II)